MFYKNFFRGKFVFLSLIATLLLSGCASNTPQLENDPYESLNRKIYALNKTADKHFLKPVAQGYDAVFPAPVKTGVTNFFNNIEDVPTGINGLLQGKPQQMTSDFVRVLINTTIGLLGVIDVASYLDVPKHDSDFGQTLGKWGMKSSPYIILPILGPSTVRDGTGVFVDWVMSPWPWIEPLWLQMSLYTLDGINVRRLYLAKEPLIYVAAFDEYIAVRNAYLQHRVSMINEGSDTFIDHEKDEFGD